MCQTPIRHAALCYALQEPIYPCQHLLMVHPSLGLYCHDDISFFSFDFLQGGLCVCLKGHEWLKLCMSKLRTIKH